MLDIDKLTTENDESPSLESILAEYADYPDAAPYASPEPEVSPESSIDFEDDDGGLYAGIDSDSAGYASPPEPEYEPDYEREAYGYTGRLRRSFERLTRRVARLRDAVLDLHGVGAGRDVLHALAAALSASPAV